MQQAMRGKLRRWMVENPRAMDAAYLVLLTGTYAWDVGLHDAGGGAAGP